MRYFGIFLTRTRVFPCSINSAKRSFYRCANAIFGKVGRLAPEETILQLIKTKCVQCYYIVWRYDNAILRRNTFVLIYFWWNYLVTSKNLSVHICSLWWLCNYSDINVVEVCRDMFNFDLPSTSHGRAARVVPRSTVQRILRTNMPSCNTL